MAREYSEQEKQGAAEELANAEQNIREAGNLARREDYERLTKARKRFDKVTGRA